MSDKYWLKITPVDSDDYGDKQFKFYSELHKGGATIWTDYHREMPTLKQVLKSLELTV